MKTRRRVTTLLLVLCFVFSFAVSAYAADDSKRLSGLDRFETAIAISQAGWADASDNVVLTTAYDFPDALCAAPLAYQLNAPILLTEKDTLTTKTANEITRLKAKTVYIIGGTGVVSQSVENALKAKGLKVTRLFGKERYETAVKVAQYMVDQGFPMSSEVAVVIGEDFADALSISPIAAKKGMPIILAPKDNQYQYEVDWLKNYISNKSITKTYIVGGADIIDSSVASVFPNVQRITGGNKYERNAAIIKQFSSDIDFSRAYIATGADYPDALAGSALAPKYSSSIILTEILPYTVTKDLVNSKLTKSTKIVALGGTGVVPESTLTALTPVNESASLFVDNSEAVQVLPGVYVARVVLKAGIHASDLTAKLNGQIMSATVDSVTKNDMFFMQVNTNTGLTVVITDSNNKSETIEIK